jgi:hypothetical protein
VAVVNDVQVCAVVLIASVVVASVVISTVVISTVVGRCNRDDAASVSEGFEAVRTLNGEKRGLQSISPRAGLFEPTGIAVLAHQYLNGVNQGAGIAGHDGGDYLCLFSRQWCFDVYFPG